MDYNSLGLLVYIAKKRGLFGVLETSTLKIASEKKISQQTVSRKLRELEAKELIKRQPSARGITLSIDAKGRELLKKHSIELSSIFARKESITGIVTNGEGEGRYYVSQKGYQKQFRQKLGFKAYPGTLNVKVKKTEALSFLDNIPLIEIKGFKTKTRSYGKLTCFTVKIDSIKGAIVIPERARHGEEIIEIIAPVYLRGKLRLKDNDKVKISC